MTQNQTISAEGREIYDELMQSIGVPELKLGAIDKLEEQFTGDSPIDSAARIEKYTAAFAEVVRLMDLRGIGQDHIARNIAHQQKEKVRHMEHQERQEEVEAAEKGLEDFNEPNT
ncbi:hypothetical protein H6770_05420 [Candidatus Peribacteria bacterium]|nr:hypothetical protein [Candidatus Peribacteria bacterium]